MQIYQFEITSICNLSCDYCPQKDLKRPKQHMSRELFDRVIEYPFMFNIACGHHFGEPLLHPELLYMAKKCRDKGLLFGFSTNAEILTLKKLNDLIKAGLSWIKISFHSEYSKKIYREIKQEYPALPLLSSELNELHDWAGQVDIDGIASAGPVPRASKGRLSNPSKKKTIRDTETNDELTDRNDCIFHRENFGVIDSRGRILACCIDAHGIGDMGTVYDLTKADFVKMENNLYFELCKECPMKEMDVDEEINFYKKIAKDAENFLTFHS